MNSYTNERGQIIYENQGDIGIARPQEPFPPEKHGIMHDIKESVIEGVNEVKEGITKLADKVTGHSHHHDEIRVDHNSGFASSDIHADSKLHSSNIHGESKLHHLKEEIKEGARDLKEGFTEGTHKIADALSSDKTELNRNQPQRTCVETVQQSSGGVGGNQWSSTQHRRDIY